MLKSNLGSAHPVSKAVAVACTVTITALAGAPAASASATMPPGAVPSLARLVPADMRSKLLVSPENATYEPDEFIAANRRTITGVDPDLLKAVAKLIGVRVSFTNVPFDQIIPGLVASKYPISVSSIDDTSKREKQVTFVDYARTGQTFFTTRNSGVALNTFGAMCGLTVAVEYGTTELSYVSNQSTQCLVAGSKPVEVVPFPNQRAANSALRSGRAQLAMADTPVADYLVRNSKGALRVVGRQTRPQMFGIAVPKGSPLVPALRAGLRYLAAHGYYAAILHKWGVDDIAIPASKMVVR